MLHVTIAEFIEIMVACAWQSTKNCLASTRQKNQPTVYRCSIGLTHSDGQEHKPQPLQLSTYQHWTTYKTTQGFCLFWFIFLLILKIQDFYFTLDKNRRRWRIKIMRQYVKSEWHENKIYGICIWYLQWRRYMVRALPRNHDKLIW